jgi:hypothetical protein
MEVHHPQRMKDFKGGWLGLWIKYFGASVVGFSPAPAGTFEPLLIGSSEGRTSITRAFERAPKMMPKVTTSQIEQYLECFTW